MLNEIALKLFTIHKLKGVGPATLKKLLAFPDFSTATLDELASRDNKLAKALESHCAYADATRSVEIDIDWFSYNQVCQPPTSPPPQHSHADYSKKFLFFSLSGRDQESRH